MILEDNFNQDFDYPKLEAFTNALVSQESSEVFYEPVDWKSQGLYAYPRLIAEPMDFQTIREKIEKKLYGSFGEFFSDVYLIYDNCMAFNKSSSSYYRRARRMEDITDRELTRFMRKNDLNRCALKISRWSPTQEDLERAFGADSKQEEEEEEKELLPKKRQARRSPSSRDSEEEYGRSKKRRKQPSNQLPTSALLKNSKLRRAYLEWQQEQDLRAFMVELTSEVSRSEEEDEEEPDAVSSLHPLSGKESNSPHTDSSEAPCESRSEEMCSEESFKDFFMNKVQKLDQYDLRDFLIFAKDLNRSCLTRESTNEGTFDFYFDPEVISKSELKKLRKEANRYIYKVVVQIGNKRFPEESEESKEDEEPTQPPPPTPPRVKMMPTIVQKNPAATTAPAQLAKKPISKTPLTRPSKEENRATSRPSNSSIQWNRYKPQMIGGKRVVIRKLGIPVERKRQLAPKPPRPAALSKVIPAISSTESSE